MSLMVKGLICAGAGLAGTFLVLILIFGMIRILQNTIHEKET